MKEVRRMERCNERGEEHSFMSCLTQGHKKGPSGSTAWASLDRFPHIASSVLCPLLLRLDMCVSSGGLPLSVY